MRYDTYANFLIESLNKNTYNLQYFTYLYLYISNPNILN